jgi:hypothetical protein
MVFPHFKLFFSIGKTKSRLHERASVTGGNRAPKQSITTDRTVSQNKYSDDRYIKK